MNYVGKRAEDFRKSRNDAMRVARQYQGTGSYAVICAVRRARSANRLVVLYKRASYNAAARVELARVQASV